MIVEYAARQNGEIMIIRDGEYFGSVNTFHWDGMLPLVSVLYSPSAHDWTTPWYAHGVQVYVPAESIARTVDQLAALDYRPF